MSPRRTAKGDVANRPGAALRYRRNFSSPTRPGFDFGFWGVVYDYWPSSSRGRFRPCLRAPGSSAQGGDELGRDPDPPCVVKQGMRMGFGRNVDDGFLSYTDIPGRDRAFCFNGAWLLVVTRHSSAGRDGCFNCPQRLMEPGRTLPALVSEAGRVSTRFLCGSFSYVEVYVLWFCGYVILEVCWLKSHKQAFIKATWLKGRVSLRRQF